jgi:excisionase family DNA binding protein
MLGDHEGASKSRAKHLKVVGPNGKSLALPTAVVDILRQATAMLSSGEAVALLAVGRELTTQQAADLLNVSRQYVVKLVNEGRIPCTKTGKHRRLLMDDVLAFKQTRDSERESRLNELVTLTDEFGGYAREMK